MASATPPLDLEILETLAEGEFGQVCLGRLRSDSLQRTVAVKILKGQWGEHPEILARTRDEARMLAMLNHRNIVRVEQLTTIEGRPALVMEYVAGVDLNTIVQRAGALPLSVAVDVLGQVASAIDAAYCRPPPGRKEPLRVVHRDIKIGRAHV